MIPDQEEEFYFTCELCGTKFPAHPDGILECKADFRLMDPDTGEIITPDAEMKADIQAAVEENPQIKPFLKGTIFVCFKCQEEWAKTASKTSKPKKPKS